MIATLTRAHTAIEGMKDVPRCVAAPFNIVALPTTSPDGPVSVYFLTPQTTAAAIPLGGHYAIDVDAAGNPGTLRRFSRSCIALPTKPRLKKGATPAASFITYLLGDMPTEIHVFSSLALGVPLMVGIPGPEMTLWQVAGASISGPVAMKK